MPRHRHKQQGIVRIWYKNKCCFIPCSSVCSYLNKINKYYVEKSNMYFRGQASVFSWLPSLYHKKRWVEKEAVLNAKVMSRHVEDFHDCKTTIESLIKLKHYNQPSRLLDIVANPLMALYFACESGIEEKTDGIVALLYSEPNEEKYSILSDTVTELSALSKVDRFEEIQKGNLRSQENNTIIKNFLGEFAHQCKKESGIESYWADVSLEKIDQCVIVNPELNNSRIIQQQGLFILCGLNPSNPYLPPESLNNFFENDGVRYYCWFSNKALHSCYQQLQRLGINRSQVYFDLEKTIEYEKDEILNE